MPNYKLLYSSEEVLILRQFYGNIPLGELQQKLYNVSFIVRSFSAIRAKALKLGLTDNVDQFKWKNLDIEFLRKNFKKLTVKQIALRMNRTVSSVKKAVNRYCEDLIDKKTFYWSSEHTNFLKENSHLKIHDLARLLNCSTGTIISKKRDLNLSKERENFSKEQDQFLIDNPKKPLVEISEFLKKSIPSIKNRRYILGIVQKKSTRSKWTDVEVQFLKDNFMNFTMKELSDKLNKSIDTINFKCMKLQLRKSYQRKWTEAEIQFIKDNYHLLSIQNIAISLDRSFPSVSTKVKEILGDVRKTRISNKKK